MIRGEGPQLYRPEFYLYHFLAVCGGYSLSCGKVAMTLVTTSLPCYED